MEKVTLGVSGIEVSRICLGCMGFGQSNNSLVSGNWTLNEADSEIIIKKALDLGINFFDTARAYADGESERVVGRILKRLAPRDQVVVATKFLPRTDAQIADKVSGQQHVMDNLNASLERLGMDYVDLYICHMWDYRTPMEEVVAGMAKALAEGKIRAIGFSNCTPEQMALLQELTLKEGAPGISSLQGHYNLIFREEEKAMNPFCKSHNIALTPYSPLASGRLVKPASEQTARSQNDQTVKSKYDGSKEKDQIIIDRVWQVAAKNNLTPTQVALGWLLQKAESPIVGATKVKHIEQAVTAVSVKLSAEDMAFLEEPYQDHALVGVMAFNTPEHTFMDGR